MFLNQRNECMHENRNWKGWKDHVPKIPRGSDTNIRFMAEARNHSRILTAHSTRQKNRHHINVSKQCRKTTPWQSSIQDYHSSKMQHILLSSLQKAGIPIFAPLSLVLYFPLEHLHLANSSWMIISKKIVEVVKLHTCHQANNKEAAIFATNVNCSFKWPTSCCSAAKWQPRICMYSVLHLPINCELTEQGECYSHIRLTFPMSKPNPTSQCQLCKQWLLGVKTPGVSI